jgi:AcrR family transcriptional regulator
MTVEASEPANRQTRRKRQTRGKLLDAANKVFLLKSVEDTTVTDITEAADVAYGTFYNYFKTVGDLIPLLVEDILRKHNPEVMELQSEYDDPAMRVAIGVYSLFQRVMSDPAMKWLTQKPSIMADEISRIVAADAIDDIRRGVESGDFNTPCDYTTLQSFCVWGITGVLHDASHSPESSQKSADNMTLLYLRILGVEDTRAQSLVKSCSSLSC